jgi:hypothetical protein
MTKLPDNFRLAGLPWERPVRRLPPRAASARKGRIPFFLVQITGKSPVPESFANSLVETHEFGPQSPRRIFQFPFFERRQTRDSFVIDRDRFDSRNDGVSREPSHQRRLWYGQRSLGPAESSQMLAFVARFIPDGVEDGLLGRILLADEPKFRRVRFHLGSFILVDVLHGANPVH